MKTRVVVAVWTFLCATFGSAAFAQEISLEPVVPGGLAYPIGVTSARDSSGRLFITSQAGKVMIYNGVNVLPTPFLDIRQLVSCCGEQGLLGIAFHPQYTSNGFFYLNYTDLSGNTVVARYRVSSNPDIADPGSGVALLSIAQPYVNHNGGQLHFGPDGYLYIGTGDGGSAGDPGNRSQNLNVLLGKMLRIDVNAGLPYGIPAGNPFVGVLGARREIWAYGLRNPWAFSFDRSTGDLWIGDVGQNTREEVDFQPAGAGGQNYGWRRMEGSLCYNPSFGCNDGSLKLPVLQYDHSLGCSITGGHRYRGSTYPQLYGKYFYGDFCSGRIWAATQNGSSWTSTVALSSGLMISSFGEDQDGELYVVHYSVSNGAIYRIKSIAATPGEIIVDNGGAGVQDAAGGRTFSGAWCTSGMSGFYGASSLLSCGAGADVYRFTPTVANRGSFDVYVRWTANGNRSIRTPISVTHAGGTTTREFNQQADGGQWVLHGRYNFNAGTGGYVEVKDTNGEASADAVRLVPAPGSSTARLTVSVSGGGSGVVTSSPAGINCGADCVEDYAIGANVTVTATPAAGSAFTDWGGPCSGDGICHLSMNGTKFLAANFSLQAIVDNATAGVQDAAGGRAFRGNWCTSAVTGAYGPSSLYSCGNSADIYRFTPAVPSTGTYDVYVRWTANGNRSAATPITVAYAGGSNVKQFNQRSNGSQWVLHGRYTFNAGMAGYIEISAANGQAAADAVRLLSVP